jgi:mannose-6-phosphate isomerase-like protein (cupin superfamily)
MGTFNQSGEPTSRVYAPWGRHDTLSSEPGVKTKILEIAPGRSLSLQKHFFRAEHWLALEGEAFVTVGTDSYTLYAGETAFVPENTFHRIRNLSPRPVRILEVQTGVFLCEDDILRIEDEYGRA